MSSCKAVQQSDEMYCAPCGLRWDVNDPDPPACRKSFPRGGGTVDPLSVTMLTPPPITAADVRRRREARSCGMMEAKEQLEKEHLLATIQMWDLHHDPKVLTEILLKIAARL